MPTRATTLHSTSTYIPTFVVLRSTCFTQLVWELKLHFYPSSGGFKKKKKKAAAVRLVTPTHDLGNRHP